MESSSLQELEQIPGVGKTIARDMQNIGIHSIDALKGRQAEQLYDRLCEFKASPVDRCMLYVFRCAIYYASNTDHNPGLPSEAGSFVALAKKDSEGGSC